MIPSAALEPLRDPASQRNDVREPVLESASPDPRTDTCDPRTLEDFDPVSFLTEVFDPVFEPLPVPDFRLWTDVLDPTRLVLEPIGI